MIRLLGQCYLNQKMHLVLFINQLLAIGIIILILTIDVNTTEMILYPKTYQTYFEQMFLQVFTVFNAMFVLFLTMDHDQKFLNPYISYFGRFKVMIGKYVFYSIILSMYALFITMIWIIGLMTLTTIRFVLNWQTYLYFWLDLWFLMTLILTIVRERFKAVAVIIVFVYLLFNLFYQANESFFLYLIPIVQSEFITEPFFVTYKLTYLSFLFTVYLHKTLHETR
ncbi:MAG: hypothetical protein WC225_03740 [Acholeplasmataceae bacterium]|nr:hypothetical protein [Acholeplasmataceae bacterium]